MISKKALDQEHQNKLWENWYIDPISIGHLMQAKWKHVRKLPLLWCKKTHLVWNKKLKGIRLLLALVQFPVAHCGFFIAYNVTVYWTYINITYIFILWSTKLSLPNVAQNLWCLRSESVDHMNVFQTDKV